MSERVGKKRTTVSNYLRLLKLPAEVQAGIRDKQIGMGHARALVALEDSELLKEIFYKIIAEDLSVRDAERVIREINYPVKAGIEKHQSVQRYELPEHVSQLKNELIQMFPSNIEIKRSNAGRGSINIAFKSDAEFEQIKNLLISLKKS